MPILNCYVDDETYARLKTVALEEGRGPEFIEQLAESAISEAALNATRDNPDFMLLPSGLDGHPYGSRRHDLAYPHES